MLTERFPTVQFQKDAWEIDEFDCTSMFLLMGSERAMLIDCGIRIEDLRGAVETITEKPLTVAISHDYMDHTGNGGQFEELWMHPANQKVPIPMSSGRRRWNIRMITRRQKGCAGAPYNTFSLYPYYINEDLREPGEEEKFSRIRDLYDGQQFDLGGDRIVTTYKCPGYSGGEMMFLDHQARTLFVGDTLNFNLGASTVPVETTLRSLEKIQELKGQYDVIYNRHHDFRALGASLDEDCLPNAIAILGDAMTGHIVPCETPSLWRQPIPLEPRERVVVALSGNDKEPKPGKRMTSRQGQVFLHIDPDKIREEGEEDGC